ncbi:MAG: hypothetical protein WBF06_06360, partial [Candidatus Acidiferrales bacterium]
QSWDSYKRLRNQFYLALFAQASIVILFICFSDALRRNLAPCVALEIVCTLLFVVAAFRLQRFRCPRCGELFFAAAYYHNVFASRCLHCELPKFSN